MEIKVKRPNGQVVESSIVSTLKDYKTELEILMKKYKYKGYIFEYDLETEVK